MAEPIDQPPSSTLVAAALFTLYALGWVRLSDLRERAAPRTGR